MNEASDIAAQRSRRPEKAQTERAADRNENQPRMNPARLASASVASGSFSGLLAAARFCRQAPLRPRRARLH